MPFQYQFRGTSLEINDTQGPVTGVESSKFQLRTMLFRGKVTCRKLQLQTMSIWGSLRIASKDPDQITEWAGELTNDSKVIVYCARGKWVSHKAADYLSRQGLAVYVLEGGLEAWKQATE